MIIWKPNQTAKYWQCQIMIDRICKNDGKYFIWVVLKSLSEFYKHLPSHMFVTEQKNRCFFFPFIHFQIIVKKHFFQKFDWLCECKSLPKKENSKVDEKTAHTNIMRKRVLKCVPPATRFSRWTVKNITNTTPKYWKHVMDLLHTSAGRCFFFFFFFPCRLVLLFYPWWWKAILQNFFQTHQ